MGFHPGVSWSEHYKNVEDEHFHVKSLVLKTLGLLLLLFIARYMTALNAPFYRDINVVEMIFNILILVGSLSAMILFVFLIRKNTRFSWIFAVVSAIAEGIFLGLIINLFTQGVLRHALVLSLLTILAMLFALLIGYLDDTLREGSSIQRIIIGLFAGLIPVGILTINYIVENNLFLTSTRYLYMGVILITYLASMFFLLENFHQVTIHINDKISFKYEFLLAVSLLLSIIFVYIRFIKKVLFFPRDLYGALRKNRVKESV
jgi:FtsH-binding integral membrane protein